ncbi:MAG: hypothetical protein FRX48_00342 [Lasallia pustulata]|uniref:SAC3/GANP/Nin1/mts3/eIF-3 p25 n=1 Tax=Lasallia pustulata TaxID=136370 RepID=A0A5M8Q0G6_9LECA|nr:MAG: hypothetical protein FRX48_00342 [Lasallia pustulata]
MAGVYTAGRRPSAAWGRLKRGPADPLENLGLPSKGDNRLLDFKTQENYYDKIVERYMQFCAAAGRGDGLAKAFASMSLSGGTSTHSSPDQLDQGPGTSSDLSAILIAMRKLREGLVASARTDPFAQRAYTFIIRAAILTRHMESYHPALLHLLRRIHQATPLAASEHHEFVSYYILDLACRQSDLAAAYAARNLYQHRDQRVEQVLKALAHDNWYMFRRIGTLVDGYQKRLMEWADDRMRTHALKCLGKSYLSVEKSYVERVTDREWDVLTETNKVGWALEGDKVMIRKIKGKA